MTDDDQFDAMDSMAGLLEPRRRIPPTTPKDDDAAEHDEGH